MLKSIIENYLISIKEIQFFHPFMSLLHVLKFQDIHLIHGPTEFGKDIIAKKDGFQYAFVIKVGNVNYSKYINDVKGQIFEAQTNSLSHPNFDNKNLKVAFVTTGKLSPHVNIALQEYISYSKEKSLPDVIVWTKEDLVNFFSHSGLEAFFNLHNNPQFIIDFYDTHSKILNGYTFQSFDIERLTKKWLSFDLSESINHLQVFFEAYYFSDLLIKNKRQYEAIFFISALVRVLSKNEFVEPYQKIIIEYLFEAIDSVGYISHEKISTELNQVRGFLDILYYPERCLEITEMIAIKILLDDDFQVDSFKECIREKGCYRPLSDNFGISVFLIAAAMLKLDLTEDLKKYLINCTVWICDRYEDLGIAPIGSDKDLEYEQLLSELLSGFENTKNDFSFVASILLDIAFLVGDKTLFEQIANELKAAEIAPIYYHILNEKDLWHYDNITSEHDPDFKIKMVDKYTSMSRKYGVNENYIAKFSLLEILCNAFLLRDRYFPYAGIKKLTGK